MRGFRPDDTCGIRAESLSPGKSLPPDVERCPTGKMRPVLFEDINGAGLVIVMAVAQTEGIGLAKINPEESYVA
jgi:hypothetical protein